MSGTSKVVRAVKSHHCTGHQTRWEDPGDIKPGDYYVHHVEFPYEWVDQITVYKECVDCSIRRGNTAPWWNMMGAK